MKTSERRKKKRLTKSAAVRIADQEVRSIDLAPGGALLDLEQPLEPGRHIEMELQVHPRRTLHFVAEVLRVHTAFWGRRFPTAVRWSAPKPADERFYRVWLRREAAKVR